MDNEGIVHVVGWIGLVCGASAIYLAMGEVLNEQFGRTILPIGENTDSSVVPASRARFSLTAEAKSQYQPH